MKQPLRAVALALAVLALQTSLPGCFGHFDLTRRVYGFNESIGDKWLRSIVTFFMVVIPVYEVCAFVDWALLNTIEFWSGDNPAAERSPDGHPPRLSLSADGDTLRLEVAKEGAPPRVLVLQMREGGAELRDGAGTLLSSLSWDERGAAVVRSPQGMDLQTFSAAKQASLGESLRSGGAGFLAELEARGGRRLAKR